MLGLGPIRVRKHHFGGILYIIDGQKGDILCGKIKNYGLLSWLS